MFILHLDGDLLEEIRTNTNKGMAIGHDRFKNETEVLQVEGNWSRGLQPIVLINCKDVSGHRCLRFMPKKRGCSVVW